MSEVAELQSTAPDPSAEPSRVPAVLWALVRLAPAVPVYALAWLVAALAALAWCGLRGGWRDVCDVVEGE